MKQCPAAGLLDWRRQKFKSECKTANRNFAKRKHARLSTGWSWPLGVQSKGQKRRHDFEISKPPEARSKQAINKKCLDLEMEAYSGGAQNDLGSLVDMGLFVFV